ncbi:MAG: divalent-cation tolerance protein CutA [Deltaproteobacteria bacterium]|nr:divalent-cation tolerance protein CutA [Deltaproteobacteria bacterium]MBW2150925.1 divalent-cation tolerance protein CutA [Deltaproteobacteria bacterium]
MKINFVYITVGSMQEAEVIGKALVESKLAACVNIIDKMSSIYMWQGKLQQDNEVIVIAKTVEAKIPQIVDRVKSLHSYECPCIVSLPVSGGNQAFLDWIADSVY